tara:strand:- start:129 stop:566 length:438 start_codon:yes stop_codon:yes gene_type:complete
MKFKNIYKNKTNVYFIFIILFILHQNSVFEELYIMSKFSLKERLTKSYGYCEEASFGFIDEIYKENSITGNIEILNDNPNFSFNNSIWFNYKINQPIDKNQVILLNNKKSIEFLNDGKIRLVFKDVDYGVYKIIKNIDNCYYLKK